MSIRKAKIIPKAKLINQSKRSIARTSRGDIILDKETSTILPIGDKTKCVGDLAKLLKKEVNYVVKKVMKLEALGIVYLKLPCEDPILQDLYGKRTPIAGICKRQPGLWNIVAYEKEWDIYPDSFDFLNRDSDLFKLKSFEKEIYFGLMRPFLNTLPKESVILDAGCGIGRFSVELVRRGFKVNLVDSSEKALKKALEYLGREKGAEFDVHWGNVANLPMFSNASFDAILAIELICYCNSPKEVVKELVRVTKKNGLIIISVEGKYGGMLSDPNVRFDKLSAIVQDGLLYKKNHLYVHYYTPASLKRLLEECGIDVIGVFGSHYVTDGIFQGLIDVDKLDNKNYKTRVLKIEKLCQNDPVLKNLARAWVAVGRKR